VLVRAARVGEAFGMKRKMFIQISVGKAEVDSGGDGRR
jgi:hypothetical protein